MKSPMMKMTLALGLAVAPVAQAQKVVPGELQEAVLANPDDSKPSGWSITGTLGGTGNFSHAKNVVGSDDGATIQVGVLLALAALYHNGQHDWNTTLTLQEALTRTPTLDRFVMSNDNLELVSTYLYHLKNPEWLGFFGQLKFNSHVFASNSARIEPYRIRRTSFDGNGHATTTLTTQGFRDVHLSSPFAPLLFRESIGAFAEPYKTDAFKLVVKLGVGFQHTIVSEGNYNLVKVVTEGNDKIAELTQIQNNHEIGAEIEGAASGIILPEVLSWHAKLNLFYPVTVATAMFDPNGKEITGAALLNTEFAAGLSLKATSYLSLEYLLSLKKQPSVSNDWQILNTIVASTSFNLL